MALELIEDAGGDPRNALFLATASELAYLPEEAGLREFKEKLGLEGKLFSCGNTQAYVLRNDDHVVVAFRGTEAPTSLDGLKDMLLTDAVNFLIIPEGPLGSEFMAAGVGARFHKGFMMALNDIWPSVSAATQEELKKKDRPLWITGHSLGGALAHLAAWLFHRQFVPVHQVYTFGSPMIGNKIAAEAFDKNLPDKIFRYVNLPDPVPRLPTVSLLANDYVHCQKEMGMGAGEEGNSPIAYFKGLVGQTVDGVLNATLITDVWGYVMGRVGAHGLESYRKLIDQLAGKSE